MKKSNYNSKSTNNSYNHNNIKSMIMIWTDTGRTYFLLVQSDLLKFHYGIINFMLKLMLGYWFQTSHVFKGTIYSSWGGALINEGD